MGLSGLARVNHSLNEMELLAKRAARGSGYCWGLAEEAAWATRWLCAHDFNGCGELARLLRRELAANLRDHSPDGTPSVWQGKGILCPVITGCLLSDCAYLLRETTIHIAALASPMLLLPFGANAARSLDDSITIALDGLLAVTDGTGLHAPDDFPGQADNVGIRIGGSLGRQRPLCNRAHPDRQSLELLDQLARNTYAPATEESRLLGAGAGLSDND